MPGIRIEADNVVLQGFISDEAESTGIFASGENVVVRDNVATQVKWVGEDVDVIRFFGDGVQITARRQGFTPYTVDYYRRLWAVFGTSCHAKLPIAEDGDAPDSVALLIASGDTVLYKIGEWRNVDGSPPRVNELLHWSGITWTYAAGYGSPSAPALWIRRGRYPAWRYRLHRAPSTTASVACGTRSGTLRARRRERLG